MNGLDLIIADQPHRRKGQLRLPVCALLNRPRLQSFPPAAALAAVLGCLI